MQNDWHSELGAVGGLGGNKPEIFLSSRQGNLTFLIEKCLTHHEKAKSCTWGIISEHWQPISLAALKEKLPSPPVLDCEKRHFRCA